jgi:hypothetical protein
MALPMRSFECPSDASEHRRRRLPVDPTHRAAASATGPPPTSVAHQLIDLPKGDAGILKPGREVWRRSWEAAVDASCQRFARDDAS